MSSADHTSVFISYARKDGAELAKRLNDNLEEKGFSLLAGHPRNKG
jgi:hypothetical protein